MTHRDLKFTPNNAQANLEIETYPEVFHPMIEFLRHHYIRPALTMDCNVPMEFIQRAYYSARYLKDEDKIEFCVKPSTYTALTKKLLRKALELPTRDYHEAPTFTQIVEMLKEIGYLGDLSGPSDFKRSNLSGIWTFLFSILNKCITAKSGSLDQGGKGILSIMWGLVKVKDIDFIDFIWEDFVATVTKKNAFVPYPRFWAIIIKRALGRSDVTLTGELPPKYVTGKVKMPVNQERWNIIPPIKEEMLAVIPDNSPVLKKYRFTSGFHKRTYKQSSDSSGEDLANVLSTVSRHIEDIEASIQHPQDTFVESTLFVEPVKETPVSFDHYARMGVIPPSVDLTKMPNKHVRFDDSSDTELDARTDLSSKKVGQGLSGNTVGTTSAKQKQIQQFDVSFAAAKRQKRRHARNVFKSYFRQREIALSGRYPEKQPQVFESSISRKEFDEMKATVQELVFSVKGLAQLNLETRRQLRYDIEKSFERVEGKRVAEYDSLTKEMKGLKADQISSTKALGNEIYVVASKLNAIIRKVDALPRATPTPVQTQVQPPAPLTSYPIMLDTHASVQTQLSHILTTLHHIIIFLRESKPRDDATTSSKAPSVTEISEAVSKLFKDKIQPLYDKFIHFQRSVKDVSENVLIQRRAIEGLAMGRETDAEKIVQVMTQFKDVIIDAYRSLHGLTCKADMLVNTRRIGPLSDRDDDPKVGDGTSASQPSVRKRVSGVSIIEVEPKRSKTSHDEQLSEGKGKEKSLASEDLPLPEIEDLDTTNNIVDEMQQFDEQLQNGKEGIEAELKSISEPTPEGAVKEKVVQNPDTTENIFDEMQLFDEELQNGKEGVDAEFKSTSEPTPGGAVEEKVVQDLDATENIADEMDCDEELQKSKEGIDAEFKSTSEPALGGALKEKVVQNLDTTENVVDEMEHFDEELQKNKEGVDAEFKSTCEPTPGGALKEKVVQDLDITMNIVDEIQQFHDELLKCKDGIDAEFNSTSEPTLGGALKEKVVQNLDKTENIVDEIQQFGEELENGEEGVDAELKSTSEPTPGRAVDEKVEQNLDATENIVDEMQQFDEELQKSKEEIDSEFQSTSEPIPGGAAEEKVVQILDATENIVDEMQQFDEDLQKSKEGIDSELKSTSEGINAELKSTSESTPGGSVNEKVVLRRSARIRS